MKAKKQLKAARKVLKDFLGEEEYEEFCQLPEDEQKRYLNEVIKSEPWKEMKEIPAALPKDVHHDEKIACPWAWTVNGSFSAEGKKHDGNLYAQGGELFLIEPGGAHLKLCPNHKITVTDRDKKSWGGCPATIVGFIIDNENGQREIQRNKKKPI